MLYVEIHNTETNEKMRLGTTADFINTITDEIGSVTTVMTSGGFKKKAVGAFDRMIQRARDEQKKPS